MSDRKLTMPELNRLTAGEFRSSGKIPVVLILENIRSGLNVGSIFRSADSFSIEKTFLCGITPSADHREVLKTALGATYSVEWERRDKISTLITELRNSGYSIYAVEQTLHSIALDKFGAKAGERFALVLGNEVEGISQMVLDHCDGALEVPQFGTKHSLNVAVCAGIVLYEFSRRLRIHKAE